MPMRRIAPLAVSISILMTLVFTGTAAAKPPPPVLTADVCVLDSVTISLRYSYSGFKRVFFAGAQFDTADGVLDLGGIGAPDPRAGSGSTGFLWPGTVVNVHATAIRKTLLSKNLTVLGVSDWIPITDNSLGGLANNGWPPC